MISLCNVKLRLLGSLPFAREQRTGGESGKAQTEHFELTKPREPQRQKGRETGREGGNREVGGEEEVRGERC